MRRMDAVPRITPGTVGLCLMGDAVIVGDCISVGERAPSAGDAAMGVVGSIAFANPKSRTLTFCSAGAFMFWGLRSR